MADPVAVIWYGGDGREQWRKEIPGPSPAPGWTASRIAAVGYAGAFGGKYVLAWGALRDCGCGATVGYRLDDRKQFLQLVTCWEHEEEMGVVFDKIKRRVNGNLLDVAITTFEKTVKERSGQ